VNRFSGVRRGRYRAPWSPGATTRRRMRCQWCQL
jgi:hypothetical protein